ncbi:MAG: hypothetical protein ACLQVF_06670 [Isosphaeraceae bacterium]
MPRILTLRGLVVAVWVACLALMVLLGGILLGRVWHPHFLPVTLSLAFIVLAALGLMIGTSWRIIWGPRRRRALSCLLIGAAPLWFLAGFFLYGVAINSARHTPLTLGVKLLMPLGESLMDLEARFRYPQRTYGDKVVMISPPFPEAEARAQVAAMDRHVRGIETRLGRTTTGMIHWARGPLLGIWGHAIFGLCMGTGQGEMAADADGLCTVDRHEVAHCVLNSLCSAWIDPPALLTEGWARANQAIDPVMLAYTVREELDDGSALSLRQLAGPDWYDRHEEPAYFQGAVLVNFLLRRFGPEKFLEVYTTCRQATFEADCRRILGLDLDGLDAANRAEIDRLVSTAGPVERVRLERLRLGTGVDAADWKAFLAEYFAAARRLLAPYHHARLRTVFENSATDGEGQTQRVGFEVQSLRSGEFASLRRRDSGRELALLAHPRRSIVARRAAPGEPWTLEGGSRLTPDQFRHEVLRRMDDHDPAGRPAAGLIALADDLPGFRQIDAFVVAAFERFTEGDRPRVRIRIEKRSPAAWRPDWRALTYVLAEDDLFAVQSERAEGVGPDSTTYQSSFNYDRHQGIPVLRSVQAAFDLPGGSRGTSELKVVERQFGPISEEEFDPDRFLDGPQVKDAQAEANVDEPSRLQRWYWLPLPIGALGLIGGAILLFLRPRAREGVELVGACNAAPNRSPTPEVTTAAAPATGPGALCEPSAQTRPGGQ